MSTALIVVADDSSVAVSSVAVQARDSALAASAMIQKVKDAKSQEKAVAALVHVDKVIKQVEEDRVSVKAPIIEIGRAIDACAKQFVVELKAEQLRINTAIGNYITEQRVIAMRAEAERALELRKIEEANAPRPNETEVQAVERAERVAQEVAMLPPVAVQQKPNGLVTKQSYEIEVFDMMALFRSHPNCVRMEAAKAELNALVALDPTRKIPGVRVIPVTKVSTRNNEAKAITV